MSKILTSRLVSTIIIQTIQSLARVPILSIHCEKPYNSSIMRTMHRYWEPNLNVLQSSESNGDTITKQYRFVSYNILAQDLLVEHLQIYANIAPEVLRWDFRLRKLKIELDMLKPDIVCLQEMQYNHLKDFIFKIRGNRQMEYIFKKKTGVGTDGCAIIYDRQKFKLIEEEIIEYHTDGISTLNRLNIAVMAKFLVQEDLTKCFVVATTHLLYNPRREDVRIAQVNVLLQALYNFSNQSNGSRLPVILSGDFNFTPYTKAFKLLTAERKFIKDYEEETFQMEAINFGKNSASTFQDQWITVDYVLKSRPKEYDKSIQIYSTYKLPTIDDCWQNGKIPNHTFGSDHFALAMTFTIS